MKKRINITVDENVHEWLQKQLEKDGTSISWWMNEQIINFSSSFEDKKMKYEKYNEQYFRDVIEEEIKEREYIKSINYQEWIEEKKRTEAEEAEARRNFQKDFLSKPRLVRTPEGNLKEEVRPLNDEFEEAKKLIEKFNDDIPLDEALIRKISSLQNRLLHEEERKKVGEKKAKIKNLFRQMAEEMCKLIDDGDL